MESPIRWNSKTKGSIVGSSDLEDPTLAFLCDKRFTENTMKNSIAHGLEGESRTNDPAGADICPVSNLPVLEDTDPTMPVLSLSEEDVDLGYDPYDTGTS